MPLLALRGLTVTYGAKPVLSDINLDLELGEVLAVTGRSGAGKSTLGLALTGLLDPPGRIIGGAARFGTDDLANLDEAGWRRLRGRHIAAVFQDATAALNPLTRIGQALALTLRRQGLDGGRAAAHLEAVGFPDPGAILRAWPHQLSGGMRQRAVIAMALAGNPELVIADEPTAALDAGARDGILALLARHARQNGAGLILITHDRAIAGGFADRELHLEAGRLTGVPERLPVPARQDVATVGQVALSISEVSFRHRNAGETLLESINLNVSEGRIFGLSGPSGTGKSTLARLIAGLDRPTEGTIRVFGAAPDPARGQVQMVFQDSRGSLDPLQTGLSALTEPLIWRGMDRENALAEAHKLAAAVALDASLLARRPRRMSGGERQRLAIARALACQARLLICDEITSALDQVTAGQILGLLLQLRRERGLTLLVISHDPDVLARVADRRAELVGGRLTEV